MSALGGRRVLAGLEASLRGGTGNRATWDLGKEAPLHVLEDGQGGFDVTAPHQGFHLPKSGSTAVVKG